MRTFIRFPYRFLADLASCLLMFDAESLVPCLLQQVVPLVTNHVDAETITEDPKVRNSIVHFGPLFSYLGSYPLTPL